MGIWQKIFFLLFFFTMTNSFLLAEEVPLKLRAEVDKAQVSTTDEFTFTVTVDSIPEVKFEFPEIGAKILGLRIISFGTEGPTKEDGRVINKKWYRLQADISGSYVLPAVEFSYQIKEETPLKVKTSEIFVEISPPGGGTTKNKGGNSSSIDDKNVAKDILDIKPPIPFKRKMTKLMIGGIIFLGLLAFVFIFYFFWWRKRKKRSQPIEKILSPREQAILSLLQLEETSLLSENDVENIKNFHFRLSEVARIYVEGQFLLSATDMTFEEIKLKLFRFQELLPEQKEKLLFLLQETDLVKYTDYSFSLEKSMELLQLARQFILETSVAPIDSASSNLAVEESVI